MKTQCPICQNIFEATEYNEENKKIDLTKLEDFIKYVVDISCSILDVKAEDLKENSRVIELVSARKLICYFIYTSTKQNTYFKCRLPKKFISEINLKSHASIYTHYKDLRAKTEIYKRFGTAIKGIEKFLQDILYGKNKAEELAQFIRIEKQLIKNTLTNKFT